jgi:ribosomal protein S1
MIHKANLNEELQDRISDIKPGMEIDFYIKEVFKERGSKYKIILTQVLRESLWDTITEGQVIEGVVKDIRAFGTLVSLDDETVGLIHANDDKSRRTHRVGNKIRVKIVSFDRMTRKILLTHG